MNYSTNNLPQVPGDLGVDVDDSRPMTPIVRGQMNLRARFLNCQTTQATKMDTDKLNILTYNVRTLHKEEKLVELENALESINWDIIGLSEIRREGENTFERSNNIFYHFGAGSYYGVGFLVAKRWKPNIKEFIAYSDRIAVLKFHIADKKTLAIVQVYAPTSSHSDDEVEEFYDLLNKACDDHRGTWTIVIGDFNAKVGKTQDQDNNNILGPYGLGDRNPRGEQLLNFAFGQRLCVGNSLFCRKPQRRWTWYSPDKVTKNEIDYCLSSSKNIIKNVEIINKIKFSSDHRPLRTTLQFNLKIHRLQVIKHTIKQLDKSSLITNKEQFCLDLKNCFDTLNTLTYYEDPHTQYSHIIKSIKTASRNIKLNKNKTKKLSSNSKRLLEERQKLAMYTPEYKSKDIEVKRSIRKDIRTANVETVKTALEKNTSLRIAMRGINLGKTSITGMKDSNGNKQGDRTKILDICTQFYKKLYSDSSSTQNIPSSYSYSSDISPFSGLEVHRALSCMKYGKSPGEDGVRTEALRVGEHALLPHLTNLYNSILMTGTFPKNFCHSNIILLHKKGDKTEIENYRPISLVSHVYKAFIKTLENRISDQLDRHQPPEQAGFRRGLSTTDHLHALNQVIEKHQEFKLPLYLAFVDYSKAFDSIKHSSIFSSLSNQDIPYTYINLLQNIYQSSTASIKIDTVGPSFRIQKGVKQGDPLSPKLFTSTLEEVFKKLPLSWGEMGVVVGEKRLSNLRFADDIVLFSSSASELEIMLNDLNTASLEVGLSMNRSKTKLMTNSTQHRVSIGGGENMEYVNDYIYLGQLVSFQSRQDLEIARRTENAWKGYWAMKHLMKGTLPLSLKRKLMDVCILPILTYGAQTWSLTDLQKSKLGVCQRAMERSILGVKLTDRIRNSILRSKTQIADVGQQAGKLKWDWAGHVCRMSDALWAKATTEWTPRNGKRPRGRPRRRWRDEIDAYLEDWSTVAQDRDDWRDGREAFALQWDTTGS